MSYKNKLLLVIGLLVMATSVFGAANDPDGTTLSEGTSVKSAAITAAGQVTAEGGNITDLNVSGNVQTDFWQLYYGEISSTYMLSDAANKRAYVWSVTGNPTGYIFFANDTVSNWATLAAGDATDLAEENTLLSLSTAADNMTNTFSASTAHPLINYTSISAAIVADAAVAVQTRNGSATHWPTALCKDSADTKVYVGFIDQAQTAFNNDAADYQVILPTGAATRTYYVYLALN